MRWIWTLSGRSANAVSLSLRRLRRVSLGVPTREQLSFASERQCVLCTFNVSDFYALHTSWLEGARHHAGLLLAPQQRFSVGEHCPVSCVCVQRNPPKRCVTKLSSLVGGGNICSRKQLCWRAQCRADAFRLQIGIPARAIRRLTWSLLLPADTKRNRRDRRVPSAGQPSYKTPFKIEINGHARNPKVQPSTRIPCTSVLCN
jgi:hypothetical protein